MRRSTHPRAWDLAEPRQRRGKVRKAFSNVAARAAQASGSAWAFVAAASVVVVWALTGPIFGFSDTWQLVINTGTTIVTFLMVFLLQHAQNKDTLAFHVKLNELIAAVEGASNQLISIEDKSAEEVREVHERYQGHERAGTGSESTVEGEGRAT